MSDRDLFSDPPPAADPLDVVTVDVFTIEIRPAAAHVNPLALRLVAKCQKCPSTEFVDRPIHDGRSVRRDCAICGWTLGFPIWNGEQVEVSE